MDKAHKLTISVDDAAWRMLGAQAEADRRSRGREVSMFLEVMAGSKPVSCLKPEALALRLEGAFLEGLEVRAIGGLPGGASALPLLAGRVINLAAAREQLRLLRERRL